MKQKLLLIAALTFFVLVTTRWFWEGSLGFLLYCALFLAFFALAISLLYQLFLAIGERFTSKPRVLTILVLTAVLALVVYRPMGIIDFEQFEGVDMLIANRMGTANCNTNLKLKGNGKFTEKTVCFGINKQARDVLPGRRHSIF